MRHRYYGKIAGPAEPLVDAGGGTWVATEKVHGAQLLVAVAGDEARFGKRKAWLADDEPFFGWQLVRSELAAAARAAAATIGSAQVVFYGELFGGAYPHPDVEPVPGLQPVQTGVWYAPDLRWAVFDVLVASDDDDDGELLAFHELRSLGLTTPPLLRTGRRNEADATAVRFETLVPGSLGLPPIAGNVAEGIVVRPDRRNARAYKRKIPEFDEEQFGEAEAWDTTRRPDLDTMSSWAERMTNPARIASAESKWGRDDLDTVLDEVELDVLLDLHAAFPAVNLTPAIEDALRRVIRAAAISRR